MTRLFYGELNSIKLKVSSTGDAFTITDAINEVGAFEFTIANTTDNRTTLDANREYDFLIKQSSDDAELFCGKIDTETYLSRSEILLTGYHASVDLSDTIFRHIHDADRIPVTVCQCCSGSPLMCTDYTTEANEATANDVPVTFTAIGDRLMVGGVEPFNTIIIQYSTKGVAGAGDVKMCYGTATDPFTELNGIDGTVGLTATVGTHNVYAIAPQDWVHTIQSGYPRTYRMNMRLMTAGGYTTQPKANRIWLSQKDPFRVSYEDIQANTILNDILDGTDYTLSASPLPNISIRGDYESRLRWIAAVADTLTKQVGNDFFPYYWWVDSFAKLVYIQDSIGTNQGDISADLSILNVCTRHGEEISTLIGLGAFDGAKQIGASISEPGASVTREVVTTKLQYNFQQSFDECLKKTLTKLKSAPKEISGTIQTTKWLADNYAVGDLVTIEQPAWGITTPTQFRVMRADIGSMAVKMDLSTRQSHLEDIRSGLQRQMDVMTVWPAGAALQTYHGQDF